LPIETCDNAAGDYPIHRLKNSEPAIWFLGKHAFLWRHLKTKSASGPIFVKKQDRKMKIRNLTLLTFGLLAAPHLALAEGTFSGFYGGATVGYGFNGESVITQGAPSVYDFDIQGNQISLVGGYNFQSRKFVLGLEADANFGSIKDSQQVTSSGIQFQGSAEAKTYYSVRARAGFAPSENLLLFATAGPAWGKLSTKTVLVSPSVLGARSPFTAVDEEKSVSGYVLGLGGEYRLGEASTLRLEYSELYYNDVRFTERSPFGGSGTFPTDNAASFVRSGVTFKF
jgi:outer membrane immunogenic protein